MSWDVFVEPFRYPFMLRALLAGVAVGVPGAVIGSFLLVRRWSLLGDAISHAVLPGVAVSYLLGWPYFAGALLSAMLTALGIGFLERNTRIKSDAAMGILFIGAFAAGLVVLSRVRSSVDVFHILFGNVLGVSEADLALVLGVGAVVLAVVAALFKELQLWAFDPLTAEVIGLPVRALHYLLMLLLSATIVAALQAVGIALALAMLVTPPAAAYLLTRRLPEMMAVAAAIGAVAAVVGLYLSFYLNVASGPAMVLVATAAFALALLVAPEQGLIARLVRRRRTAAQVALDDTLKALEELGAGERHVTLDAVAREAGVSPSLAARRVQRLAAAGLVDVGGEGARLTAAGVRHARTLIRSHRLWERYLTDVAGMPWDAVHEEAHRLEHVTTPRLADELSQALGHPTRDPHGAPIPSAEGELPDGAGLPLDSPEAGTRVEVVRVADEDAELLRRLRHAGIHPGARLAVERAADGSVALLAADGTPLLTLSRREAALVRVRPQAQAGGGDPAP